MEAGGGAAKGLEGVILDLVTWPSSSRMFLMLLYFLCCEACWKCKLFQSEQSSGLAVCRVHVHTCSHSVSMPTALEMDLCREERLPGTQGESAHCVCMGGCCKVSLTRTLSGSQLQGAMEGADTVDGGIVLLLKQTSLGDQEQGLTLFRSHGSCVPKGLIRGAEVGRCDQGAEGAYPGRSTRLLTATTLR